MVESITGVGQGPKEAARRPSAQQVKAGTYQGETLDLLTLHFSDIGKFQIDRGKNREYGRDIFKGQISLLQLERLQTSGLLNPSQVEQTQKVLQEPRAAFLIKEIKGAVSNKIASESMQKAHGRFLRRVALNQGLFEQRLAHIVQEGEPIREAQVQEVIESRTAIYNKSSSAFENLVSTNLRLAISIARKHQKRGLELADLIEYSYEGLIKAAARFDYRSGFAFTTYATWWVRQTISRAISDYANPIRIPIHTGARSIDVYRMRDRLTQELGRIPTKREIFQALGPGYELAQRAISVMNVVSLNMKIGNYEETELGDLLVDDKPEQVESAFKRETREKISEALAHISPRERLIIELRFGLNGGPMTLEAVGRAIGVTRERVRQIEKKALKKLKHPQIAEQLRPLVEDDLKRSTNT